jgi:hypothetical protein
MRTNWGVRANKETPVLLSDYEPSVGAVIKALASYWGNEISDPVKVAQLILSLAASERLPAHLLAKPRRRAQPMQNSGERPAFRLTLTLWMLYLPCDSERSRLKHL